MANKPDEILSSIKKLIGFDDEYDAFDLDLLTHINSAFFTLHQLGVGKTGFVANENSKWNEFYDEGANLQAIRTYIYYKVRLAFDPPQSSYGIQAFERYCEQLEWRLNVEVETEALDNANS